jgi:hypothetical protein
MYNVELHQAPPGKDYNDILMAKKKRAGCKLLLIQYFNALKMRVRALFH